MGIPKFYRWLSERYPLINQDHSDNSKPEIENLYLDMNGIIHMSSHSNSLSHLIPHISSALPLDEVWLKIFRYIEMLVQFAKPTKLLYLALDGVAPRAKMNNQRERRYKSSFEVRKFVTKESEKGNSTPTDWFDSNQISPGTEFMIALNEHLDTFIRWKLQNDSNWKKLQVILSGSDVPGEGEHKIMRYIRTHRGQPNVKHCLYGLDADLILLSLLSHEPHLILLREEVQLGGVRSTPDRHFIGEPKKFTLLFIPVLREYLKLELQQLPEIDLERFIDDFVVLMLFIGNDFLPRLPTFEINEGAIEYLLNAYMKKWATIGYLSKDGVINWNTLEKFMEGLPEYEQKILKERLDDKKKPRRQNSAPIEPTERVPSLKDAYRKGKILSPVAPTIPEEEEESGEMVRSITVPVTDELEGEELSPGVTDEVAYSVEQYEEAIAKAEGESAQTEVLRDQLRSVLNRGMEHVKRLFYQRAFEIDIKKEEGQEKLSIAIRRYLEGLQWVMFYYFRGCQDWHWFYPYNYAPMISDFKNMRTYLTLNENEEISFTYRPPFRALDQLVGVLPPASRALLPPAYQDIMDDPNFQPYFPREPKIEYDMMCAKIGWDSMKVIVPFVPFEELIRYTDTLQQHAEIIRRNNVYSEHLFEVGARDSTNLTMIRSSLAQIDPELGSFVSFCSKQSMKYEIEYTFEGKLVEGTVEHLAGYPSLSFLFYTPRIDIFSVHIFTSSSNLPSIILDITQQEANINELWNSLKDNLVYIDYPTQRLAYVTNISSRTGSIHPLDETLLKVGMTLERYTAEMRMRLDSYYRYKKGINIMPEVNIVYHVKPLKALRRTLKGKYIPEWEPFEVEVPLEVVMFEREPGHHQDIEQTFEVPRQLPESSEVVLMHADLYGAIGRVTGYCQDKFCPDGGVRVEIVKKPKMVSEHITEIISNIKLKYYTLKDLASRVGKPMGLLSRMLGSIKLTYRNRGQKRLYQIGLNLKHDKNFVQVTDWCRWGGFWGNIQDWEYSEKSAAALESYVINFPGLWSKLQQNWQAGNRRFDLDTIFTYGDDPFEELQKVALWVVKLPCSKLPWASIYSEAIPSESVKIVEQVVRSVETPSAGAAVISLNPSLVYIETRPWTPFFTLPKSNPIIYDVGDRVVNLCTTHWHYVPFGAEGTVVAKYDTSLCEVLFDDLILGSELGIRRAVIPTKYLLNASKPFRQLLRKGDDITPNFQIHTYDEHNFTPKLNKLPVRQQPVQRGQFQKRIPQPQGSASSQEASIPQSKQVNPHRDRYHITHTDHSRIPQASSTAPPIPQPKAPPKPTSKPEAKDSQQERTFSLSVDSVPFELISYPSELVQPPTPNSLPQPSFQDSP
jgi:5'-3' exoribonuclease 1